MLATVSRFPCCVLLFVDLGHSCLFSGAEQDGKYKDTVNLPKTAFGMRANALVREPEIQKLWEDNEVFKRVAERNDGVNCRTCRYLQLLSLCMF